MNERIRELWSQAGGHYNSGNQHTWPEYTITNPEKFAELIVRECIKQVDLSSECFTAEQVHIKSLATNSIKEHFGVKE